MCMQRPICEIMLRYIVSIKELRKKVFVNNVCIISCAVFIHCYTAVEMYELHLSVSVWMRLIQ